MRTVVDTNILIRALIKPQGTVGPVLDRLSTGDYRVLYSPAILEEIVDVLSRRRFRDKYGVKDQDIETLLALFILHGEKIVPQQRIEVCRDPKDDKFLEIAVEGTADIIVTGDEDLLVLNPFEGIPIVKPAEFLYRLARAG